jgi:hypothetical protein
MVEVHAIGIDFFVGFVFFMHAFMVKDFVDERYRWVPPSSPECCRSFLGGPSGSSLR